MSVRTPPDAGLFMLAILVVGLFVGIIGSQVYPIVKRGERLAGPGTAASKPPSPPPEPAPGPEIPPQTETAPLTGVVRDAGGSCVEGAEVLVFPLDEDLWVLNPGNPPAARAETDATGIFAVPVIAPGRYYIEALLGDARGFLPLVTVVPDSARTVEIRLLPIAAIEGRVLAENRAPVAGAVVSTDAGGVLRHFYEEAGLPVPPLRERIETRTDVDGRFRLAPLPEGRYEVEVVSPVHSRLVQRVIDAPVDGIDLVVAGTRTLTVQLSAPLRSAPSTVRLRSEPSLLDLVLTTKEPADGPPGALSRRIVWKPTRDEQHVETTLEVPGLMEGRYRITALSPGLTDATCDVLVEAGRAPPPARLELTGGVRFSGGVRGGVKGAVVVVFEVHREFSGVRLEERARTRTGKGGSFSVAVGRGERVVRAFHPGCATAAVFSPVFSSEEIFRMSFPRGKQYVAIAAARVIAVRAVWPNGWPVREPRVRVRPSSRLPPEDRAKGFVEGSGRPSPEDPNTWQVTGFSYARAYDVHISAPGSAGMSVSHVTFADGPLVKLDITIPRGEVGTVRGSVVDEQSRPVPGAIVLFPDGFAEAAADGRFSRSDVTAGPLRVSFLAVGYTVSYSETMTLRPGEVLDLGALVLPRTPVVLRGLVTDSGGGLIPGAHVKAVFPDVAKSYETMTDIRGEYEIRGPGGVRESATVRADAPGYAGSAREVRVLPTPERGDLSLVRYGAIEGKLSETDPRLFARPGKMYRPARFHLWLRGTNVEGSLRGGRFRIADVPPGVYGFAVSATAQRYPACHESTVTVEEGKTTDLGTVELEKR